MGNKRFDQILNDIVGGKPELPSSDELNDSGKVSAGDVFAAAKNAATSQQGDAEPSQGNTAAAAPEIKPPQRSVPDLSESFRAFQQKRAELAKQKESEQKQKELSETQKAALNASDNAASQAEPLKPSVNAAKPVSSSGGGSAVSGKGTVKVSEPKLQKPVSSESDVEEPVEKAKKTTKKAAGKQQEAKKTPTQKAIEKAVGEKSGLKQDKNLDKKMQDFYNKYIARTSGPSLEDVQNNVADKPREISYDDIMRAAEPNELSYDEAMQGNEAVRPREMSYVEAMQDGDAAEPNEMSYDEAMSAGSPNSMLDISWDEFEKLMDNKYGEDRPKMLDLRKLTVLSPSYDSIMGTNDFESLNKKDLNKSPTYDSLFESNVEQSPSFDSMMQKAGSKISIGSTFDDTKNQMSETYEDIMSVPAFRDFYENLEKDNSTSKAEGVNEGESEERTDNIAKKLKTPNDLMDERIGLLKENAKNTAPKPLIHERKDDTVRRSKEVLSFLRKGVKISGDEKVKVNADDAKEYLDNRAEEEIDEESNEEAGSDEAVKTTRVPSRMTRQTFEEIEERSKTAGAKHKQKELKDKRASLKRDLADVDKVIKELEAKDKESLSNTDRELNTAKLFGQRKKAKAIRDEIEKIGKQLGLKENKVTFSSNGKINFNRFSNQKFVNYNSKSKKDKKGKKGKKGYYSSKNKKYTGKQTRRRYAWRKQSATEKAKKLKMKEVTLHSETLEEALIHFCEFLKLNPESPSDRAIVMEMARIYSGICPDRSNKLFNQSLDKVEIKDRVYIDAFQQMERNYREDGFLFSYRDYNYKIAGNYRFVVPIMPPKIAKALTRKGALLENWSIEELARAGYNEWMNKVVPAASVNAKKNQKLVLNDMMQAIAWSYGDASLKTGLLDADAFTINEAFDSLNDYASLYPDNKALAEINNKCRDRVLRAKSRIEKRNTKTVKGQDGTYKTLIDIAKNTPDVFATMVKLQRAQSLMLDVTLGASSALEHMKGNFSNSLAAKIMLSSIKASGPTAATYEMAKTKEVQQTIMDAVRLLQVGGPDALVYAVDSGYVLGQGDARDFAQQFLLKRGLTSQEAQNYMNMSPNERVNWIRQNKPKALIAIDKYANLASNFATGEWVCQGGDAKRFFEFMLYYGQKDRQRTENDKDKDKKKNQNKRGMNLDPVTLERMLLADPQGTITGLVARPEGISSLVTMMDCTLGGMNPLTSFYDDLMGRLGIGDLAFANFVTLFPKYGFMAIGKALPLSHTGMYVASLGYYFTKSVVMHFSGKGVDVGDIASADTKDRLDTLIGGQSMRQGRRDILDGLYQNLVMDFAQLGTNIMFLLIQLGTLMMLGFKEPPDPSKKFVYSEWRLFTNLTPDGEGVQIKTNWFLNEIYGVIGGPAVLTAAIALRDKDFATAAQVFLSGGWDIMMNTGVSQLTKLSGFITDFDKKMIEAQTGEQVEGGDPLWNKVLLTAVSGVVSCIEPRFIKTLYSTHDYTSEGNLAHSTTQIYDPASGDEKRTMKTTAEDAARRRLSYNDPAMAAIFNFVHFIGGEQNATGYFRNEMPLVTEVEPTSMVWKKYFGEVDGRELTWDSSDEDKQVIVNRVLNAYDRYDGIDGMIDNGIVIPYVSRYYVTSYLYACQNANWNSFYERQYSKGGFSSQEERQEAAEDVQQKNAALNEQIKAIQDAKLPYSPYTLHRYETDYWKYYYVEDESGNRTPTNPVFYWFNHDILHDPSYHEEYYASGDHKSSLNPYLMVDTDNVGTFDREKRTPWYDEDGKLDKEKLLADIGDEVIESGQFKGQKLADVIGGQLANEDNWIPTTGSRASVYVSQPWETDHDWPSKKDSDLFTGNLGENGKNKTSEEWKQSNKSATNPSSAGWGYTSSRRYSRSGGSGRAASLYSHPASSLNAERPATMYSKNRNYTRYDYLRPDFETKGSRDAYKRSDI